MKKHIYILTGLGADERVFQNLNFNNHHITFIQWIKPIKNEKIEDYAKRILNQINFIQPIIIGLSFGGIISVEIAKLIETEKVILIASAKTKSEIPFYYRWIGKIRIHKLIPIRLLKTPNMLTNWLFGAYTEFDKLILKYILKDTDEHFLKWAIDQIVKWSNQSKFKNLIHIHGTGDRILPIYFLDCDIKIDNGGHLMTLNKSNQLNKILKQEL